MDVESDEYEDEYEWGFDAMSHGDEVLRSVGRRG
jgi:hypothetical protein